MLAAMTVTPGQGVDFSALAQILALVVVVYVLSSVLSWAQNYLMAGVTQRTMYRLREDTDTKLGRLPLRYFDSVSRGDVLSRVTNDIDNIANTLQQTLTQLITSVLTVIGVLAMMFWISPLLAVISLLTVPLSFWVTMVIAKRSQPHFVAQWKWTGALNGHVEETYTGHDLVKVFGHRRESIAQFDDANALMYESSFKAQFISGIIQPAITVVSNLNYVAIAVIGGLRVASGTMSLGDVQAFIQYSRQFTMPITQIAAVANILQSGVASVERVFELLDEPEEEPDVDPAVSLDSVEGRIVFDDVAFRYLPDAPLIEDFTPRGRAGRDRRDRGAHGCGQDDAGQPAHAVLRRRQRPHHDRRRPDDDDDPRRRAAVLRDGAAGHLAVRGHDPGQHRVRRGLGHAGAGRGGRAGRPRGPLRPHAAATATRRCSPRAAPTSAPASGSC